MNPLNNGAAKDSTRECTEWKHPSTEKFHVRIGINAIDYEIQSNNCRESQTTT